jgi:hypothetical protein
MVQERDHDHGRREHAGKAEYCDLDHAGDDGNRGVGRDHGGAFEAGRQQQR